jgi:four helix bundle protein
MWQNLLRSFDRRASGGKTLRHERCTRLCMNPRAEELKRRTFKFALQIIGFCRILRRTWEGRELSDQLFRAGTRVGANYRAACRARSHADFVAKLGLVVDVADESIYWLELTAAAGIVATDELRWLLDESSELSRIFNQSQLTARRNAAARKTLGTAVVNS